VQHEGQSTDSLKDAQFTTRAAAGRRLAALHSEQKDTPTDKRRSALRKCPRNRRQFRRSSRSRATQNDLNGVNDIFADAENPSNRHGDLRAVSRRPSATSSPVPRP